MKVYINRNLPNYISGIHYVYIYYDPDTKVPFYVGKGKNKRYIEHLKEKPKSGGHCNYSKIAKIQSILKEGKFPIIQFILSKVSEKEAYEIEQKLIKEIGTIKKGTGPLLNRVTEGWTKEYEYGQEETYKKISIAQKKIGAEGKHHWQINPPNNSGKNNPRYGDHRTLKEIHGKEKANEIILKYSKRSSGENNSHAKKYKLTDPNGKSYIIKGQLNNFCKENKLSMVALKNYFGQIVLFDKNHGKANIKYPQTKGWKLEYANS